MVAINRSNCGPSATGAPGAPEVVSAPKPRTTLVRRALRERRALRQAQASQVVLSRRWVAAAAASSPYCSSERLQLEELRRSLIAVRVAKASPLAIIAASIPPPAADGAAALRMALPAASAGQDAVAAAAGASAAASTNVEDYFAALMAERGRPNVYRTSAEAGYLKQPTSKQVEDYQQQPFMSDLARKGDIAGLQKAVEAGRGMDASNKFGESVVHVACRRGNLDVLRFLVDNGGDLTACDDLGRFPLHEVCWAAEPRFDIVRVFLEEERRAKSLRHRRNDSSASSASSASCASSSSSASDMSTSSGSTSTTSTSTNGGGTNTSTGGGTNTSTGGGDSSGSDAAAADGGGDGDLNMLLVTDKRGCSPLRYVKKESWPQWRRFLDEVVDEFWPALSSPQEAGH